MTYEVFHDKEVLLLFKYSSEKLKKVDANAIKQKKQIITNLAENLEGKIPTEFIMMEIVNHLPDQEDIMFIGMSINGKFRQEKLAELRQLKEEEEEDAEEEEEENTEEDDAKEEEEEKFRYAWK